MLYILNKTIYHGKDSKEIIIVYDFVNGNLVYDKLSSDKNKKTSTYKVRETDYIVYESNNKMFFNWKKNQYLLILEDNYFLILEYNNLICILPWRFTVTTITKKEL